MRAGEDPERVDEGGDPACWAHLLDDEAPGVDGDVEDDVGERLADGPADG